MISESLFSMRLKLIGAFEISHTSPSPLESNNNEQPNEVSLLDFLSLTIFCPILIFL